MRQIVEGIETDLRTDFDPEEDGKYQSEDESGSEESDDGLAGTEHYAAVRYVFSTLNVRIEH